MSSLSLSLSLADTDHPEGIPWTLPRLDPSTEELMILNYGVGEDT